ncbi:hypothetical protein MTR_4g085060 [Medicago truncatula]|uniref:Uncharacterized protein n=1 Tax=Medicago truncatula TaxID=3880 RepID=A0A072UMK7_MEDTR|nr:hypothetical protein MTR_4g085060 [Medicago truncatula]
MAWHPKTMITSPFLLGNVALCMGNLQLEKRGVTDITLDCVNRKVVIIFNGEILDIFEEEKEEIQESFEGESMGKPIYDEEYVGADICEVFEEEGNIDLIYDDEHSPDDIHEVFEKEEHDNPIYDEEYILAEYGKS